MRVKGDYNGMLWNACIYFFIKLQVIINGMCFQYILCLHKIIDAFHTMKKLRSTFFIFKHFAMLRKEGLPTIKNCVGYHFKTPFAVTNCFLIKTWSPFSKWKWFLENQLIVKTDNDILTSLIYLTKKWNFILWLQSIITKLSIFLEVPNIESMYWINIYLLTNAL